MKSKSARPSVEPYVPPSRRSQPGNAELAVTSTREPVKDDAEEDEDEEEEEEWEKLADSNDDSLQKGLVEEVISRRSLDADT